MPTIFILFGFIFKFYSDDHEPIHVHVEKDGHEAKYNVLPEVTQVYNHGFKKHEISMIEGMFHEAGLCELTEAEDAVCYDPAA